MTELYRGALQDVWMKATCYGCGPANDAGLQIKSYWNEDGTAVVATYHPAPKYNAGFPNVMYGGLVASLIDCHSIWTAIAWAYRDEYRPHGSEPSISYVTGKLEVSFRQPTPLDALIKLRATVESSHGRKSFVHCTLGTDDMVTAEADVLAVRIEGDKSEGV